MAESYSCSRAMRSPNGSRHSFRETSMVKRLMSEQQADDEPSAVPSGDGFESALITIWENLSTIRPDDFKQPDGEAETQVNRAYCAAENALLEVGRLRREGHS